MLASIKRPAKFEIKTDTGKNDVINVLFGFLKNDFGLKFAHKLVLWLYKLIQMTICFIRSNYFIKTSR